MEELLEVVFIAEMQELPYTDCLLMVNPNTFYSHLKRPENPIEIKIPDVEIPFLYPVSKKNEEIYMKKVMKSFVK